MEQHLIIGAMFVLSAGTVSVDKIGFINGKQLGHYADLTSKII
ncbi:TPA: hypothetical protein ACGRAQ_000407 [Streptococcus agalactiae]